MTVKVISASWLIVGVVFCGCRCVQAAPVTVNFSPSYESVSFLGENGGFCSGVGGSDQSCGLGPDLAHTQTFPSYEVQVSAQFGVFAPSSPTSSAVATAFESTPIDVEGGTGPGYLEMQVDTSYSNPVNGSAQVSVTGATLVSGMFADNYNSVILFQYGTPFTLSFYATVTADSNNPYSDISIDLGNYRVLENFPSPTPEVQTFALGAVGLLFIGLVKIVRGHYSRIA